MGPERHPRARKLRLARASLVAAMLGVSVAGAVCVLQAYLSFKYPVKWDRYQHAFSDHLKDRVAAYVHLFRSAQRASNAAMPAEAIQRVVRETAQRYGVDPCLVAAIVTFESGLNPNTITTTGAMGLMALQPDTARALGVDDAFDPQQNVDGGTRLLQQLSAAFGGDVASVLAAYNAGPNAVTRHHGVPPYRETRDYVNHVGAIYGLCRAQPAPFFTQASP